LAVYTVRVPQYTIIEALIASQRITVADALNPR
jgi:hypothetical protein